ncbi:MULTISPECIES: hypothetical protein [unclassified Streptomyces]|uniref:hypothetical protein n=1 Tax=unclassified Streptomyces TaxID=2593676 RepID=UPI00224EFB21|nr:MULTISPECIES: hypothetical protein [unclassified Streptomyces]MCX4791539.1 hypothetical protein [Streptomyces sp. NBC_01221]MCX4792758.1 hypothetical protein [Streptomyces sp. NBC_01242]WSP60683.1 hypothetical protein OG466_01025 [Streptomyces sp. NBC_01240]WSU19758.1 hypothetical protein OG508_00940 [Streptomyces sp. NBC_01108]
MHPRSAAKPTSSARRPSRACPVRPGYGRPAARMPVGVEDGDAHGDTRSLRRTADPPRDPDAVDLHGDDGGQE